jgi:glutamate racemase
MKIGFFDSGLGGLTILKAVTKELPDYDYVFYGDTANLPFGTKTEEEVYAHTVEGLEYLFAEDCSLVIIACNTASAETVRRVQNDFLPDKHPDKKVLGVIVPTVETLMFESLTQVLLLATNRTVSSDKYKIESENRNLNITLKQLAAPDLVPLIEIGDLELAAQQAIKLIDEAGGESEVVVLGCTHYTEIKSQLRQHYDKAKKIISQDEIIPNKIKSYLESHPEIESKLSRGSERKIHLTEHKPYFDKILQQLLGGVLIDE